MTSFVEQALDNTRKALQSDVWYSNKDLGVTQFIVLAVHGASDSISRSNWRSIVRDMDSKELPYHIERFKHFAVGFIEYLIIDISDHNSIAFIEAVLLGLQEYALYDEYDHSELEYEEYVESVTQEIASLFRRFDYRINEDEALNIVLSSDLDSRGFESVKTDDIADIIAWYKVTEDEDYS